MSPPPPSEPRSLCAGFIAALPVQHAAISTMGNPFEVETVCASDTIAAELDEAQLQLGVGPCWDARTTRMAVLVPDIHRDERTDWPMLRAAASAHGIRSAYAFPMAVGAVDVGAVDLYADEPSALTGAHLATASTMAGVVAIQIMQKALADVDSAPDDGSRSQRVVHQACGMIIAQMRISPENALLILRAHAFASDRSVRDVANDVVERRIDFSV